jgi:hypothetical protein
MHLENDLGPEFGALLDCERFVFEVLQRSGAREIHRDVWSAFRFDGEGMDDALSRVFRVADGITCVQTEGGLPAVEGLVMLVW